MSEAMNTYEERTDAMAEALVSAWNKMSGYIGDRPFEQEHVPERQQVRQYQIVRNNPQAWAALAKEHGWKNTTEYMLRGERLSAKYPEDALIGQESLPPAPMPTPTPAAVLAPTATPSVPTPTPETTVAST